MQERTYEFDPPLHVPPHGTLEVRGGLEFCTVTIRDGEDRTLALGRYQLDSKSKKYKLISGTAYELPKEEGKTS